MTDFPGISEVTGTRTDPILAGNSAFRLYVIATQVLLSNGTRNR